MAHTRRRSLIAVALTFAALGCGTHEPPPPAGPAVSNPTLGIALASLPDGLKVATNAGAELVLVPAAADASGRMSFALGSEKDGVNLVAAVTAHRKDVEGTAGASYLGARQLVGPLGNAFWSRARRGEEEETLIFSLSPSGKRMLTITYRYPAGADSSQRVQQVLDVLAEVEAASTAPPAASAG